MNEHKEWELKNAFPPMPDACRNALMGAARSVKEEEKMKRFSLRTALIAALIVIATMTAALAAGELLGWTQFYTFPIPKTAQDILESTEAKTYQAGPLTFTVNQLMTDGRIALCSATAETADGTPAIVASEVYDAVAANGENGRAAAERLGVAPDTSWIDAAHQLGLPFYRVDAWIEVDERYRAGDDMGGTMWDDQNRCVSYSMAGLNENTVGDRLPATLKFIVTQYDAENIEPPTADWATETFKEVKELNRWKETYDITLPVPAPLQEKTYAPEAPYAFSNGLTLNAVRAQLTVAGAYVTGRFTLREGADFCDTFAGEIRFLDEKGEEIRWGMAESGIIDIDHLPQVTWGAMLNMETLPDTLTVTFYGTAANNEQASVRAAGK